MGRRRIITYAVYNDSQESYVVSRMDSELAWPMIDYEAMGPEDDFAVKWKLGTVRATAIPPREWDFLTWTRKIPVETKNAHREFWGFPLLKEAP